MKKLSLSLIAAGVMAAAGFAHADAIFYPNGTMVDLGPTGADNLALDSSTCLNADCSMTSGTAILGAGPAATTRTTTVTTTSPQLVYVQPNINWDRGVAIAQVHRNYHLTNRMDSSIRHQAAATFDVPARAGEASTMTGGAPNVSTDNQVMVVGSYSIPANVVTVDSPYYVFSY